jgi:hypothetical protein
MKVKVTEAGVVIPKEFLVGVAEVEIRKEHDIIMVVPATKEDPIFKLGMNPVACNTPDASENPDKYLYASDR